MKRDRAQPLRLPVNVDGSVSSEDLLTPARGKASDLEKRLLQQVLQRAGDPPISIILWDGYAVGPAANDAKFRLNIADRGALWKLAFNPDLQFGELYTAGRLRVEGSLSAFMELLTRCLPDYTERGRWVQALSKLYLFKRNSLTRARDNIHHHYDLGNDFYKLWLDAQMLYTCAYFPTPETTLEQAQIAKMDHVARKLRLQPGEEVVEAGCGWGALALHLAKHYGVKVKAYNISKQQLAYARERAQQEGMTGQVEYIESDYRDIQGDFDAFVSVGMLEHVGLKHYGELGAVMANCLRPHGRGLIHSIGRNRPAPMNAWIERRIFPGAYPPSLSEMRALFEPWRFSVLDVENLRLHYAETLRHWLQRYENQVGQVQAMFDESFVRAWRLYLAGSMAAFAAGELQLFQVVFSRHDINDMPLTRHFLYTER